MTVVEIVYIFVSVVEQEKLSETKIKMKSISRRFTLK